jgi:hypothetical protein
MSVILEASCHLWQPRASKSILGSKVPGCYSFFLGYGSCDAARQIAHCMSAPHLDRVVLPRNFALISSGDWCQIFLSAYVPECVLLEARSDFMTKLRTKTDSPMFHVLVHLQFAAPPLANSVLLKFPIWF